MNKKLCQHATKDEVVQISIDELHHPFQNKRVSKGYSFFMQKITNQNYIKNDIKILFVTVIQNYDKTSKQIQKNIA